MTIPLSGNSYGREVVFMHVVQRDRQGIHWFDGGNVQSPCRAVGTPCMEFHVGKGGAGFGIVSSKGRVFEFGVGVLCKSQIGV